MARLETRVRAACQQIAMKIWRHQPERSVSSVALDRLIEEYGGGRYFPLERVREWVREVAPAAIQEEPQWIGLRWIARHLIWDGS